MLIIHENFPALEGISLHFIAQEYKGIWLSTIDEIMSYNL
jgi:hypothetical protein